MSIFYYETLYKACPQIVFQMCKNVLYVTEKNYIYGISTNTFYLLSLGYVKYRNKVAALKEGWKCRKC